MHVQDATAENAGCGAVKHVHCVLDRGSLACTTLPGHTVTVGCTCRMEERMATLIAEADVHKAQLESTAGILGQQQQLEEAARRQVCTYSDCSTCNAPW